MPASVSSPLSRSPAAPNSACTSPSTLSPRPGPHRKRIEPAPRAARKRNHPQSAADKPPPEAISAYCHPLSDAPIIGLAPNEIRLGEIPSRRYKRSALNARSLPIRRKHFEPHPRLTISQNNKNIPRGGIEMATATHAVQLDDKVTTFVGKKQKMLINGKWVEAAPARLSPPTIPPPAKFSRTSPKATAKI